MAETKTTLKQVTVQDEVKDIFRDHIGLACALTKRELLVKIYGKNSRELSNSYIAHFYWTKRVLPAMHSLRRNSKCFIVSEVLGSEPVFFVVKTNQEADHFADKMNNHVLGIERSIVRCRKAVRDNWHKQF